MDASFFQDVVKIWGGPGIVIIALIAAVMHLYTKLGKQYDIHLECAKSHGRETAELASHMNDVIKESTSAIQNLAVTIQNLKEMMIFINKRPE